MPYQKCKAYLVILLTRVEEPCYFRLEKSPHGP
jgi:hypothetical protein